MTAEVRHRVSENVYWNLFVAPVLGLMYVIVLPFIAIGTMAAVLAKKALEGMSDLVGSFVSFGWRPMEAHLAGKRKGRKGKDSTL
jgi:hypothetical protein